VHHHLNPTLPVRWMCLDILRVRVGKMIPECMHDSVRDLLASLFAMLVSRLSRFTRLTFLLIMSVGCDTGMMRF
jgi:hypothetical protein